jgi:hypothetical protein
MTSSYLTRPIIPLAALLSRMLATIETELATAAPTKKLRLRQRAELMRGLLTPSGCKQQGYTKTALNLLPPLG